MTENQVRLWHWVGAEGIAHVADIVGDRDAPPVVFVHGGGQSRHAWRSGAEAAAAAGFLAISIDQRGHGDSGWAPDGDYSPAAVANDLELLVRRLGRPAVLVGASRGGYATLVAAARPGMPVRALVLVEIAPRIDQSGADQVRGFMRASADGFATIEEASDLLDRYMHRTTRKDPERLRRSMRQDEVGRWFWRWDPKVAKGVVIDPAKTERELEAAARALTCPVLLVRGERSELVKEEHAAHLRELAPSAEVTTIPGVGHMVSGDENDLFNAAIIAFLLRLPAPAGDAPVMAGASAVAAP